MKKIFELTATNGRKSFYGKAKVIESDNKIELQSYDTIVAQIIDGVFTVNGEYSLTTSTHIKSFRNFYSV